MEVLHPAALATSAICLSSVLTITASISLQASAVSILHLTRGLPQRESMFFLGRPFEPPLAGISARTLSPEITKLLPHL